MRKDATLLWIVLLTAASLGSALALACATPFAALAVLAAVHMRRQPGMALMLLCWAGSQAVGFGLLGYSCTAETLGWGASMALAAVIALLAAERVRASKDWLRLGLGYVAAFIAFKAVILLASLVIAPAQTRMLASPMLLARQLGRDALFLIGLELSYRILVTLGMPAIGRPRQAIAA